MTATYVAAIDWKKHEMERPFMRIFVEGDDEASALAAAERACEKDEVARSVTLLQPILDGIRERIASGTRYGISWKHEGTSGPVHIYDLDAMDADGGPQARPFGSDEPDYVTALPWMRRTEANRLASYLGLTLEES